MKKSIRKSGPKKHKKKYPSGKSKRSRKIKRNKKSGFAKIKKKKSKRRTNRTNKRIIGGASGQITRELIDYGISMVKDVIGVTSYEGLIESKTSETETETRKSCGINGCVVHVQVGPEKINRALKVQRARKGEDKELVIMKELGILFGDWDVQRSTGEWTFNFSLQPLYNMYSLAEAGFGSGSSEERTHITEYEDLCATQNDGLLTTFSIITTLGKEIQKLHEKEIAHADIKPDNIMLDKDKDGRIHAHLIDFGAADYVGRPVDWKGAAGGRDRPPYYSVYKAHKIPLKFNKTSDIFSFACICYMLLSNEDNIPERWTTQIVHDMLCGGRMDGKPRQRFLVKRDIECHKTKEITSDVVHTFFDGETVIELERAVVAHGGGRVTRLRTSLGWITNTPTTLERIDPTPRQILNDYDERFTSVLGSGEGDLGSMPVLTEKDNQQLPMHIEYFSKSANRWVPALITAVRKETDGRTVYTMTQWRDQIQHGEFTRYVEELGDVIRIPLDHPLTKINAVLKNPGGHLPEECLGDVQFNAILADVGNILCSNGRPDKGSEKDAIGWLKNITDKSLAIMGTEGASTEGASTEGAHVVDHVAVVEAGEGGAEVASSTEGAHVVDHAAVVEAGEAGEARAEVASVPPAVVQPWLLVPGWTIRARGTAMDSTYTYIHPDGREFTDKQNAIAIANEDWAISRATADAEADAAAEASDSEDDAF
jgi:serine/threonine protein kinase